MLPGYRGEGGRGVKGNEQPVPTVWMERGEEEERKMLASSFADQPKLLVFRGNFVALIVRLNASPPPPPSVQFDGIKKYTWRRAGS